MPLLKASDHFQTRLSFWSSEEDEWQVARLHSCLPKGACKMNGRSKAQTDLSFYLGFSAHLHKRWRSRTMSGQTQPCAMRACSAVYNFAILYFKHVRILWSNIFHALFTCVSLTPAISSCWFSSALGRTGCSAFLEPLQTVRKMSRFEYYRRGESPADAVLRKRSVRSGWHL